MSAKIRKVTLTAWVWNWIFQHISGFELPEKIGEKEKYGKDQRALVKWEAGKAERELKAHSHYAKIVGPRNSIRFGAEEDWVRAGQDYEDPETGKTKTALGWEHVGAERTYTLDLSEAAVSGLMWMAVIGSTPPVTEEVVVQNGGKAIVVSHQAFPNADISAFIMPLLVELNMMADYREALGLPREGKLSKAWKSDEAAPTETAKA